MKNPYTEDFSHANLCLRPNSQAEQEWEVFMKVAIISSVYEQTPPLRYGGIERVLDFLVKGLKKKGHDVTLFATGDSGSPCDLVHFFDRSEERRVGKEC